MKTYLIKIFNSKNAKKHFITDLIQADTQKDAENKVINKKYYFDSLETRILGICKKAEVIHEI
jgi:hypothetical protein